MEVNSNSQNTTPNTLGNVQRPGEYLRHIRLTQKRDLNDVAKALNIPIKTLEALEKDAYTVLPEAAFIKGYYRAYAKHLGVDASSIIQRFDEIYVSDTGLRVHHALKDSPIKIMGRLPGSNTDRNRKWLKRILVFIVAVVVIALVVMGIQKWSSTKKVEIPTQATPTNAEVLPVAQTTAFSGDELQIKFAHPSSVRIVDSTGKVLASGRQAEPLILKGQSPFQIRLDDAQAVSTLSLNNEVISLSPYTVNGKADFRLSR